MWLFTVLVGDGISCDGVVSSSSEELYVKHLCTGQLCELLELVLYDITGSGSKDAFFLTLEM